MVASRGVDNWRASTRGIPGFVVDGGTGLSKVNDRDVRCVEQLEDLVVDIVVVLDAIDSYRPR